MKRKMNTYLKLGLILLVSMLVGAVIGVVSLAVGDDRAIAETVAMKLAEVMRSWILAEVTGFLLAAVIVGEFCLVRVRKLGKEAQAAADEAGDRIEYQLEKVTAWGAIAVNASMFLTFIALSTVFTISYVDSLSPSGLVQLLLSFLVILLNAVYNGFWGVRLIKQVQKTDPAKKGDPTSLKFTREWVESCDEAERDMIYRASFDSYTFMNQWIAVPMIVTLLAHFLWETGVLAIVITVVFWMMLQISYIRSCIRQKKERCR